MYPVVRNKKPGLLNSGIISQGLGGLGAGLGIYALGRYFGNPSPASPNLSSITNAVSTAMKDKVPAIQRQYSDTYNELKNQALSKSTLGKYTAANNAGDLESLGNTVINKTDNALGNINMGLMGTQAGGGLLNKILSKFPGIYSKNPNLINSIGTAARDNTGKIIETAPGVAKLTRFGSAASKLFTPLVAGLDSINDLKQGTRPELMSIYSDGTKDPYSELTYTQTIPRLAATGLSLTNPAALFGTSIAKRFIDQYINRQAVNNTAAEIASSANGKLMNHVLDLYRKSGRTEDGADQMIKSRFLLKTLLNSDIFKDKTILDSNSALAHLVDLSRYKYGI